VASLCVIDLISLDQDTIVVQAATGMLHHPIRHLLAGH
jgi:hypothetical protein